jgi:signal peptidase
MACRFLPYVGYVTIAMVCILIISVLSALTAEILHAQNDFPQLKYALLGGMGLLALVQRE